MLKSFCDRCGKETQKLREVMIPTKKISNSTFEVKPFQVCFECEKEYNDIIEKLADIRFILFRSFLKGGE